jgi:four helix bundle protein
MYGGRNMGIAKSYKDLNVYQKSYEVAMEIFDFSKKFPKDEMYSLTSQIRRSSRSVSANIAEAYRRRIYPKSFISKLNESEAEATETQNWLDYSYDCGYIKKETKERLYQTYNEILGMLVNMRLSADKWKP